MHASQSLLPVDAYLTHSSFLGEVYAKELVYLP